MFDINTVPSFIIKEQSYKDIEIMKLNADSYILYNNGLQWMTLNCHNNKQIKEMYSLYDLAYGDVILSGLGFGILPLWIANKPGINTVTVYEISQDLIDIFLNNNECPSNLIIKNENINTVKTDKKYDCILLDHYELQHFDWRMNNMRDIVKNIPNHTVFWSWSIEDIHARVSYNLTQEQLFKSHLFFHIVDFSTKWPNFKDNVLKISSLPNLSDRKINEYIYTYYDCIGYSVPAIIR